MRYVSLALMLLIGVVHAELWFGKGGMPRMMELQSKLTAQQTHNAASKARNAQILAEVRDLKEGLEMVEEKARFDLGMLKPNEILVQIAPITTPSAGTVLVVPPSPAAGFKR
jgi:cell division protein FtsB